MGQKATPAAASPSSRPRRRLSRRFLIAILAFVAIGVGCAIWWFYGTQRSPIASAPPGISKPATETPKEESDPQDQADANVVPVPIAKEVQAAWEKAGLIPVWIGQNWTGLEAREKTGEGLKEVLPAFVLSSDFKPAAMGSLPAPEQNFGLHVTAPTSELQRFDKLRALIIGGGITSTALKELTTLKQLHALDIYAPQLSDAQLKMLSDLPELRFLSLRDFQMRGPGLKGVASRSCPICAG